MMRALLAAFGLWLCATATAAGETAPTLTVVGDDAPPFRIFERDAARGFYFDVLNALAKRAGIHLRFVEVPSARALAMMRAGEADLMVGLLQTPERTAYLHYLHPNLPPVDKRFLVRPGGPRITRFEDLAHLVVGVERGKSYSPQIDQAGALARDVSDSYAIALRKLGAGRIDAVLIPEAEADWLIRETGQRFDKAEWVIAGQPTYITLSRASPHVALLPRLEQALVELATSGEIGALALRYR
ncbi:hypothetical protein GCM10025771_08530 [Niveibacterium umoris]|uniref:Polar amino acid transport system substrate-binding protein n=1 Tax=Niveibacterium umoris TaxID=1193620 RepID=A0A840BQ53_9RHOO|nr:transporter substrate-binding domain-containing protein [Niveibacterium umoris]MBB4013599.1 polar amino acid transport system substrate-binding protein [Niveibacterium umoris]